MNKTTEVFESENSNYSSTSVERALKLAEEALNAMLTHMGMDEDEWTKPTFDQSRKTLAAIREARAEQALQNLSDFHQYMEATEPEYYDCGGTIGVVHKSQCSAAMKRNGKPWKCVCGANLYIDSNGAPASKAEHKCSEHPDAPHGFDRNASHNAGRYVCECEAWGPDDMAYRPNRLSMDTQDQYEVGNLEDAEKFALNRLLEYKESHDIWIEKTEWVQKTGKPHELGIHRADILKQRIQELEQQNAALKAVVDAWNNVEPVKQEPVYAFRRRGLDDFCTCTKERYDELVDKPNLFEVTTFYAAPVSAKREWVELTDDEMLAIWNTDKPILLVFDAVIAAFKEKNT